MTSNHNKKPNQAIRATPYADEFGANGRNPSVMQRLEASKMVSAEKEAFAAKLKAAPARRK